MTTERQRDPIEEMREHIDALDSLIVRLVGARTKLTVAIGLEKQRRGMPTMQPQRHGQVVDNYMRTAQQEGRLQPGDAIKLSETVQSISRGAQDQARAASPVPAPRVDDLGAALVDFEGLAAEAAAALALTDGKPVLVRQYPTTPEAV